MMDFLFFVKTFILTVAIVLVMQIEVGKKSIETHAMGWVQSSSVTEPMNVAARGAAKMIHDLTAKIWSGVHHNVAKNKKEESKIRASSFSWTHSSSPEPVPESSNEAPGNDD